MKTERKPLFRGIAAALPTPFTERGEIDEPAFAAHVRRLLEGGVTALCVACTTGEAGALTESEYCRLITLARESAALRVPVIAGAGGTSTEHAVRLAALAGEAGADALLAVTPYYCKATPKGLVAHYDALGKAGLPILFYNVPSRTGVDLTPELCRELAERPYAAGIKEASGRADRVSRIRRLCGTDFPIYCGSDELLPAFLAAGAAGAVSVTANVAPALVSAMYRHYAAGKMTEALALADRLAPLADVLFREANPIPVKSALALMGIGAEAYRLPLCPPTPETRRQIARVLSDLGLLTR